MYWTVSVLAVAIAISILSFAPLCCPFVKVTPSATTESLVSYLEVS